MDVQELNKLVKEGMDMLAKKKLAEDLVDSVAETMEERLEMSKTEAKKLINHAYEKAFNTEKYVEKKTKIEELYDNLEAVDV